MGQGRGAAANRNLAPRAAPARHKDKKSPADLSAGPEDAAKRDYGRAMLITGEVQVSQCAGLFSSPSALSTESFTTYWPFGTV